MKERIYIVKNTETDESTLVRAGNRPQAVAHVCKALLVCNVASQEAIVEILSDGGSVETAGVYAEPEVLEIMGERTHVISQ